jgi:putative ABC transport system permease protein
MLAKSPAFTLVAAVSLALGIGANSALFSFHDALLFRPLPVAYPSSVVTVAALSPDQEIRTFLSYPNYRDLREKSRAFDGLVAYRLTTVSFARSRQASRDMRLGMQVSDNFFDVMGVQPSLGRRFAPEEGQVRGRDAVVVLGHDFWANGLSGDAAVVGSTVLLNGIDFTVVGVAPASFTGMDQFIRPAFFVPVVMADRLSPPATTQNGLFEDRAARSFSVKGRLQKGASLGAAQIEMAALWKGLEQQYPEANRNRGVVVRTEFQERIIRERGNAILVAMMTGLVSVVLLIACANVANLMLGRARARSREIAVRLALGVSRARLLRQLLTESLLIALVGGAAGLGVAYAGIQFLASTVQTLVPTDLPVVIEPQLDPRVVTFSLALALASAVLFGLAPVRQSLKTQLVPALKSSELAQGARHRTTGRNILVVAQVALSMVLLVAAGMLLEGFHRSLTTSPGFRTDHLMLMSLDTSLVNYTPAQTHDFYRRLVTRVSALPGVSSAALTSVVPLDPSSALAEMAIVPEGYQFPKDRDRDSVPAAIVDERYFGSIGTAIVRGRAFTADDKENSRRVAIVNEELAKTYWPDQDPIGKRLRLNGGEGPWVDVVGLTRTGLYRFPGESPTRFLYLPFAQNERPSMSVLVETVEEEPPGIASALRETVRTLDINQPVFNVRSFASFYQGRAIGPRLLLMRATAILGAIGLILALVGLYGLVAYSVARRTREIGIRMAIGAGRSDVLRMVLGQGLMLATIGVVAGGAMSLGMVRLLSSGMVGLGSPNAAIYVVVPAALLSLTLVASYFPARRAARVDPLRALRDE